MPGRRALAGLALGAVLVAAVPAAGQVAVGRPAPDFQGGPWINSPPLSVDALRGQVIFVEFWTYGCINCRNVIPRLREWHAKYAAAGLRIVGVHTPEFFWEKPHAKVVAATRELGIRYPVVQDNDLAIWRRYGVWAWPTAVVVDRKGVVRYRHVGEGAYEETEAVIRRLLAEGG